MIDPMSSLLVRHAGAHGPIMLMYHAVTDGVGTPSWPWAVSIGRFREHLDLLASHGWSTPTMAELANGRAAKTGRSAVITFDDGYADNLAAWRELQSRGMRATWFVVTGSIGRDPAWDADGRPAGRLLGVEELRSMHRSGMEIGSHTVSHLRLPELDTEQLRHELSDSRECLEDVLGEQVSSFAYPYGAFSNPVVDAVREAGYLCACTTRSGWALRDGDPHRMRRISVFNDDTAASLARKLYFGANEGSWQHMGRYFLQRLHARVAG